MRLVVVKRKQIWQTQKDGIEGKAKKMEIRYVISLWRRSFYSEGSKPEKVCSEFWWFLEEWMFWWTEVGVVAGLGHMWRRLLGTFEEIVYCPRFLLMQVFDFRFVLRIRVL